MFALFPKFTAYHQLSWADFKGKPSGSHAAMTSCGVYVHTTETDGVVTAQWADAYFVPSESWTRTKSLVALQHEQGHLDIARMFARQVRLGINADSLMVVYQNTQLLYDQQTEHGTNVEEQTQWLKQIQKY